MLSGKLDYALARSDLRVGAGSAKARLRILAVRTSQRLQSAPDVPTMTESGVPMDLNLWWGVMVATGTPRPIVDKINEWFTEIVSTEETREVPRAVRRRSHDPYAGRGAGDVPEGDPGMGRVRPDRQDPADLMF